MNNTDISKLFLAIKVYKHTNNVAMTWTIEDLMDKEDYKLVQGTIAMLSGKYDEAQEAFLESGNGELALEVSFFCIKTEIYTFCAKI